MMFKQVAVNKLLESYFLLSILFIAGIVIRCAVIHNTNIDTNNYLIPWYDYIAQKGILTALGDNFANYTPPYTYLLALMTAIPIPKLIAIKIIPIVMDLINSILIYKIINSRYPSSSISLWAAVIFWCLPSVILNSAYWGQADSFYTGFLLLTIYFLLLSRPLFAMLAFSISVAFKLQAIFMAPLLVVLLIKPFANTNNDEVNSNIKFWHFLLVPMVYCLLCLPAVLLGRKWSDVLAIYLDQAKTFKNLSDYAPNPYVFISNQYFHPVYELGLVFAVICVCVWIAFTAKKNLNLIKDRLLLAALASVAIVPFLLPKMHERYFYPADALSLVVAFFIPKLWYLPIGFQVISCLSYYPILSDTWAHTNVKYAAIINTCFIGFILWKQFNNKYQ